MVKFIFSLLLFSCLANASYIQNTNIHDGSGNSLSSTSGSLNANVTNTVPVTGTFFQATQPVSISTMPTTPVTGTFFQATQPVSLSSSPLPSNAAQETGGNLATIVTNTTGLATASAQTTGNSSLSSIQTSVANIPASPSTAALQTTGNSSLASIVTNTANIPASPSTSALQTTGNSSLSSIVTNTTGLATASAQTTGNTSLSAIQTSVANIPASPSTAALQTTGNTSLASIVTNTANIPAQGTAAMSAATPVNLSNALQLTTSTFNSTTGVINTDMLTGTLSGWYDAQAFQQMAITIYTTTTVTGGIITFETTDDKTNDASGVVMNLQDESVITQTNVTTLTLAASTIKRYRAPISKRYVRLRLSTAFAGTGTVGATVTFKQTPYAPIAIGVVQATAGSLNMTVGSGTVTTISNGQTASGSAVTGSPFRVAGKVLTTLPTTLANGQAADSAMTTAEQFITKQYGSAENDWQASSGTTPLATTSSTALKAAGAASIRNFVTGCQLVNTSATVSTTVSLLDGASVIWTGFLPATTAALQVLPINVDFPTPLRGTAATAMNIQLGTVAASVYYNCQGYQSF